MYVLDNELFCPEFLATEWTNPFVFRHLHCVRIDKILNFSEKSLRRKRLVSMRMGLAAQYSTHSQIKTELASLNQSINQSINQLINQSINQSIDQSIDQSISQSIDQSISQSINKSIIKSTNQSLNQSINKSVNQSISH